MKKMRKTKEEKITEYKVLKLRNELLTTKLREKETKFNKKTKFKNKI